MSEEKGKKRKNKAYYRQNGKKQKGEGSGNRLMPGQQGFLVMCNNNEVCAVRESYNILNEYADAIYGQGKDGVFTKATDETNAEDNESDSDDLEAAMKKEVESMKAVPSELKRFQNCKTQAKNCVFIRSTVLDPVKVVTTIMEDIASRHISRARYAARILPVVATCKAHSSNIIQMAEKVLCPVFTNNSNPPSSYTILFKARNNNTTSCGKLSLIPALKQVVKEINPSVTFTWSDFDTAILVEIVCTVCCLIVAPSYSRLRKYNLQELVQGPKVLEKGNSGAHHSEIDENVKVEICEEADSNICTTDDTNKDENRNVDVQTEKLQTVQEDNAEHSSEINESAKTQPCEMVDSNTETNYSNKDKIRNIDVQAEKVQTEHDNQPEIDENAKVQTCTEVDSNTEISSLVKDQFGGVGSQTSQDVETTIKPGDVQNS